MMFGDKQILFIKPCFYGFYVFETLPCLGGLRDISADNRAPGEHCTLNIKR